MGIGAVEYPQVLLVKDGAIISADLNNHLISIEYIDAIDNEVDGLNLRFSKMFMPPAGGDKIKVSIGFGLTVDYIGEFYVTGWAEEPHAGVMDVKLTPIDFSKKLKEKRTAGYDKVTLDQILKEIAKRHELEVKNDLKEVSYTHKAQTNESDLVFMHRIAKENNATFAIKNGTIIFRPKSLSKDKESLPKIRLSLDDMAELRLEYQDKTEYLSGEAKFRDTKKNKTITVKVGEEDPKLIIEGSFKNEAEAKLKIQAALDKENAGKLRGSCSVTTQPVISGAILTIDLGYKEENDLEITEVRHSISRSGGYIKNVAFTK